jgi:nitroreductase
MDVSTPASPTKQEALALRYGASAIPAAGPWNAHIDLLLSHRSVRGYRPDALPTGTLETLIAAAQSAATSSNLQTWSVIAVNNPESRALMMKVAGNQKHIAQCPLFLVWLADLSRNERLGAEEGVEMPTIPYLESYLVAAIDAALAAQNAVVAAESLGLSTVYIGALRNDPEAVAKCLGLPPGVMGVFGLCVGYAAPETVNEVKPRLSQAAILSHETYGNPEEPKLRAAYDAEMRAFSERNGMGAENWSGRVIQRMGKLSAMGGRDKLTSVLRALGFPLK